mmetsp:Transcript_768/g.1585  ORF Transcript_768/g.1585 Transcript_768/m.1585 type:complete len:286 (+) Transcript_768:715-1572(+)
MAARGARRSWRRGGLSSASPHVPPRVARQLRCRACDKDRRWAATRLPPQRASRRAPTPTLTRSPLLTLTPAVTPARRRGATAASTRRRRYPRTIRRTTRPPPTCRAAVLARRRDRTRSPRAVRVSTRRAACRTPRRRRLSARWTRRPGRQSATPSPCTRDAPPAGKTTLSSCTARGAASRSTRPRRPRGSRAGAARRPPTSSPPPSAATTSFGRLACGCGGRPRSPPCPADSASRWSATASSRQTRSGATACAGKCALRWRGRTEGTVFSGARERARVCVCEGWG